MGTWRNLGDSAKFASFLATLATILVTWRPFSSATETDEMLEHMYSSDTLCTQMQAFQGNRRFREGKERFEDAERSGRPQTSRNAENIEKFSAVVRKNRLQTTMRNWHVTLKVVDSPQSADEINSASQAKLKDMAKNGFQKCFDDLYKR
ncbi:hypothetical protein TNCV_2932821 [Trichonephila clavipes]|nr:hypothetical protein TNCV_2932821 [Trichonephila clavipes]